MAAIAPAIVPPSLGQPAPTATAADIAKRAKVHEAAQSFESQFLSSMLQEMFAGVKTDGPFGGGVGEEMFRSIMTQAMADKMAKTGSLGISDSVQREILKMQGLT